MIRHSAIAASFLILQSHVYKNEFIENIKYIEICDFLLSSKNEENFKAAIILIHNLILKPFDITVSFLILSIVLIIIGVLLSKHLP